MTSPTFEQIWGDEWIPMWKRSRRYYRFRSLVRMAFWIPVCTATVYMFLAVVSVYS